MHFNHKRWLFASLCVCAAGLLAGCNKPAGTSAEQSGSTALQPASNGAQPTGPVPPPVQLARWIQATPNRSPPTCSATDPGTTDAPFFTFNGGSFDACLIDGPYPWDNKDWFVMRIKGYLRPGTSKTDLIRVCSAQAAHPSNPTLFVAGPCHTTTGVGKAGCEVCSANGVPQP